MRRDSIDSIVTRATIIIFENNQRLKYKLVINSMK